MSADPATGRATAIERLNLSLADVTLDGNSGVGRLGLYLEDSTNVQTAASSGTPLTIMGVSLNGATLVDSSNVDIDGFSITQTNIYGILIGGGSGIAFRNGVIAEVNTSSTVAAGGAITVTSNLLGAGGSVDATFEDIMISGVHGVGVPGNRVAIFLSDVGGTLTTTFNRITIDAMDSGGTVVTDVGFGWSVGGTTNISGTGNVTNTAAECVQAVSVGGTLNGTVEINGAPHPTSPLAC